MDEITGHRTTRVREVLADAHAAGMEGEYAHTGGGIWLGLLYLDEARLFFDLEPTDEAPGLYWRCTWEAPQPDYAADRGWLGYNIEHSKRPDPDAPAREVTMWLITAHLMAQRRFAADNHARLNHMKLEAY
jgi:hypothetical protein